MHARIQKIMSGGVLKTFFSHQRSGPPSSGVHSSISKETYINGSHDPLSSHAITVFAWKTTYCDGLGESILTGICGRVPPSCGNH